MQSNNVKFVTDSSKVYRLGGNDWYAVEQDEDKVMLVDTDCKIGDKALRTPWSSGDWKSESGENGQAILDYCNNLVNTHFSSIKHAVVPRNVEAGTGKIESAYIWPMSYEKFEEHKNIGGKIVRNSGSSVWTRTFSGIGSYNHRYAWCVGFASGDLNNNYSVSGLFRVAPAFNLKKSSIIRINSDGEIILKPADTTQNNTSSDTEKLLFQVREYAKTMADVNRFEQKLAYAQGNDISALKAQKMVDVYERILYLANNITD